MTTRHQRPTRRDLVRELDERGCNQREIAELLGCTIANVSYHLRGIRAEEKQTEASA